MDTDALGAAEPQPNSACNANHGCTRMHTDHTDKEDEEKYSNAKLRQGRAKGRKDNEFIRENPVHPWFKNLAKKTRF
jgi:hypothetical protein